MFASILSPTGRLTHAFRAGSLRPSPPERFPRRLWAAPPGRGICRLWYGVNIDIFYSRRPRRVERIGRGRLGIGDADRGYTPEVDRMTQRNALLDRICITYVTLHAEDAQ